MKNIFFVVAPILCLAQPSDPRIGTMLGELASVHPFAQVAISPDGKRVAWIEELIENRKDTGTSTIYIADLRGKPMAVAAAKTPSSNRELAWSPDSVHIAFLSDREKKGQMQVYTVAGADGRARKLTALTGYLTDPRWSPDGSRIAVLFAENAPSGGGPLEAEPVETGVIGGETHNQRLTIVDAANGTSKQVSPPDLNIYEYDWSPDGRTFALSAAPGPGDNNWWIAQLYIMPAETGKMTAIFKPETQIALPRWSPDGSSIGFIQGLMSDEGFTGGEVFTIPAAGGTPVNRTPDRKSSVSSIQWISPEKMLLTEIVGGGSAIATLEVATGRTERLWQGGESIHAEGNDANFSLARDGKTAGVIRSDWQHPPEIWAGAIGDWKQITHVNGGLQSHWGEVKNLDWTNDGFSIQGWLLYPRDYSPAKRYPMVVSIHGGPAGFNAQHWPLDRFDMSILSALGYFVFYPNPRGSYGQGEAFTRANVKDFGGGDLRDILAGVDAVLKTVPVDKDRIGVTGWSYGGYMTMFTVTQTNRFRAAVAGAGIANYQSYYGQNSIDQWMIPYFGASVYDDPAVYAKASPITFIKNVKTPTLVVVGERDGECPAPQSYEFWHALKAQGTPTELVVYPGEGHRFRSSEHKRDVMERTVKWFEQYLR
jgi:dipeptidyl aminopeptidase/acylaminoacyl peptidase